MQPALPRASAHFLSHTDRQPAFIQPREERSIFLTRFFTEACACLFLSCYTSSFSIFSFCVASSASFALDDAIASTARYH